MYTSLLIYNKFKLMLFYIVYETQYIREESPSSSLAILLFRIIWNSGDQNNDYDNPEKKLLIIKSTQFVKYLYPRPNLETSRLLSVRTYFGLDLVLWIAIANQPQFPRYGFCVDHFRIRVIIYPPCARNLIITTSSFIYFPL